MARIHRRYLHSNFHCRQDSFKNCISRNRLNSKGSTFQKNQKDSNHQGNLHKFLKKYSSYNCPYRLCRRWMCTSCSQNEGRVGRYDRRICSSNRLSRFHKRNKSSKCSLSCIECRNQKDIWSNWNPCKECRRYMKKKSSSNTRLGIAHKCL